MNADYGLGSPVAPALPPERRETHGSNLFRTSDRRQGLRNQCGSTKWTPPPWPSVRQASTPAGRLRLLRPVVGPGRRRTKPVEQGVGVRHHLVSADGGEPHHGFPAQPTHPPPPPIPPHVPT